MARVLSEAVLREAARIIHAGGVIAYPTEYCFGLGCMPGCVPAIRRILGIKQRGRSGGLLLIARRYRPIVAMGGPVRQDDS